MKRFNVFILSALAILSFLSAQQAQVTNVIAAQRTDGSQLVDITYDLTEDALFTTYNVIVEISFDNGVTYNETLNVSGDVGAGIQPGNVKQIVWNLGQEYTDIFNNDVKVRVIATGYVLGELPFEFVTIPAGDFTYGQDDQIQTIDYDFEIMKYEVTNAEYAEFLIEAYGTGEVWMDGNNVIGYYGGDEYYDSGNYTIFTLDEPISWNGTTFMVTEGYGVHPVVYVTWFGAYKFAEHYGIRLPIEEEWEKAARGNTGYDYPWGDNIDGSRANYWNSGDPWDNGTTPVGFYNGQNYEGFQTTDSPSPFGVYDMAGNVWEWCDSWWDYSSSYRVFRGGAWGNDTSGLRSWFRFYVSPSASIPDIGFRCSRTPSE